MAKSVDLHFGQPRCSRVYDVDANGVRPVAARAIAEHALEEEEDPRDTIYRMIADCQALLVAKIGVAPQEALSKIGIEATDLYAGKAVDDGPARAVRGQEGRGRGHVARRERIPRCCTPCCA